MTALLENAKSGGGNGAVPTPDPPRRRWTRRLVGFARSQAAPLPALGRAPETLAVSCAGVLLVALAYAWGRTGQPGAQAMYWGGQALVFAPVAMRLLTRRLAGTTEPFVLVMGLAINQYLLKWMYSPDQFKFPDELQHWVATTSVVETGRLFGPNPALPVSPFFPGLEEMGAAVVSLTGLSVTTAGLIVAGLAHLVFVAALFALVRRAGASATVAGLGCVVYATGMHYLFFDSMYLYQTAALPFFALTLWASRGWRPRELRTLPFAIVGVVSIAIVTVSHHVTAAVLVGTLALLAACDLVVGGKGRRRWASTVLTVVAAAALAGWVYFVARHALDYLETPARAMWDHLIGLLTGRIKFTARLNVPLWQVTLQAVGLVALLGLFATAATNVLRRRRRNPWRWALLIGAFGFFAATGVRFLGEQGPELAGRASTFTYLPMSMVAGYALVQLGRRVRSGTAGEAGPAGGTSRRVRTVLTSRMLIGVIVLGVLMVGARVSGWPPLWAQLPGSHVVSGFERSVDPAGVSAANWTANRLPRHQRMAADLTGWTLSSTYGRQDAVGEAGRLFYAPEWDRETNQERWDRGIDYLWVDLRMSEQLPKTGAYFPQDPLAGTHTSPIPRASLDKFDRIPGASRVYDGGHIRIYDLEGR